MEDILINTAEAAKRLGISLATLTTWRCRGGGPRFVKLGNRVRYAPVDLAEFVEARRRDSASAEPRQGGAR